MYFRVATRLAMTMGECGRAFFRAIASQPPTKTPQTSKSSSLRAQRGNPHPGSWRDALHRRNRYVDCRVATRLAFDERFGGRGRNRRPLSRTLLSLCRYLCPKGSGEPLAMDAWARKSPCAEMRASRKRRKGRASFWIASVTLAMKPGSGDNKRNARTGSPGRGAAAAIAATEQATLVREKKRALRVCLFIGVAAAR
jgi:hypothetical protein